MRNADCEYRVADSGSRVASYGLRVNDFHDISMISKELFILHHKPLV
jgi:hypothetical protein